MNAYVNLQQVADDYDVDLTEWFQLLTTRTVLEHLNYQGLEPIHHDEGGIWIRIELLPLLSDKILIDELLDDKISEAKRYMGRQTWAIDVSDPASIANVKVSLAENAYRLSQERLQALDSIGDISFKSVRDISDIVPEVHDFIDDTDHESSWNPLCIFVTLRRRSMVCAILKRQIDLLRTAIHYEVSIQASQYRLLLAMLMIHSSNARSFELEQRQANREFKIRLRFLGDSLAMNLGVAAKRLATLC